ARATDLSGPRRAGTRESPRAARVSGDDRYFVVEERRAEARAVQPHSRPRQGNRIREAGERSRAAHAGAGRIRRRELWAFRPGAASLCPFHLADPPLRRPPRAPRPGARAETRIRWPS